MTEYYIEHHEADESVMFYSDNPIADIEEQLFIWWEYEVEPNYQYMLETFGSFRIMWQGIDAGIVTQELDAFHIYPID